MWLRLAIACGACHGARSVMRRTGLIGTPVVEQNVKQSRSFGEELLNNVGAGIAWLASAVLLAQLGVR
jgi:hypothetical protein